MLRPLLAIVCFAMGLLTAWVVAAVGIDEHVNTTPIRNSISAPSVGHGVLADELSVMGNPIEPASIDEMPYRQWRDWARKFDSRRGMTIHSFHALGWPLRCFVTRDDYPANGFYGPGDYDGARLRYSSWLGGFFYLPITPCWPALIVNAVLFALAWGVPVGIAKFSATSLARHRREKRGHCRTCGFSRAGLPRDSVCPECGRSGPERHSFASEPFPGP